MFGDLRNRLALSLAAMLAAVVAGIAWLATGATIWLAGAAVAGLLACLIAFVIAWQLQRQNRQIEKALKQGERLRLIGQTAGGLAHQLRNGVAAAKLALQLHTRSCSVEDDESLDAARRQMARVEADLARFLDLGRDDMPRRPCSVVDLVEEAVALLRPHCRHAEVQLCWEPPAVEPIVIGDPGRVGHVLVNLLSNAVDAAGPGGYVEVTVDLSSDGLCVVEVWDNGSGLDAKIAGRLFEPFVTGKADGVGLGLFVARQAAEAHGGRLDYRREGGRTCFRMEMPATEREIRDELTPPAIPVSRR